MWEKGKKDKGAPPRKRNSEEWLEERRSVTTGGDKNCNEGRWRQICSNNVLSEPEAEQQIQLADWYVHMQV